MSLDLLILNSGEWLLSAELAASPWYILIYRQRGEPRNELHLWLPRQDTPRSATHACKRYWVNDSVRWCVEVPRGLDDPRAVRPASPRIRFTAPEGLTLWSDLDGPRGLGDLSDDELARLLRRAAAGSFSGV